MSHKDTPKASVIITTYNSPAMLALVLLALDEQDETRFEVIVSDDGSTEKTRHLLDTLREQIHYPLRHSWQPDEGFRAAMSRNKAVVVAEADYLIFLDGDCVPRTSFIRRHLDLAERAYFVAGNRVLINKDFSSRVVLNKVPIHQWGFARWLKTKRQKGCNRILPCLTLPLDGWRKLRKNRWKGAKTCNLGVWRQDFIAVNGLDESYQGWGYEDSDLVIRLIRHGVKRKAGRFAVPVFHLWHPENDRGNKVDNLVRLGAIKTGSGIRAKQGVEQYL